MSLIRPATGTTGGPRSVSGGRPSDPLTGPALTSAPLSRRSFGKLLVAAADTAALTACAPRSGTPSPDAIHWGFDAVSNANVDEFYAAAMAAGAKDNISSRARLEYYPGYYAADVFDPDGYSFEAVYKS